VDPTIRCLILTSYDDEQAVRAAVLAGASGYVLKQIRNHDLANAIRRAAAGESLFEPGVKETVVSGISQDEVSDPLLDSLSPQERRVLHLIGEGMTNRQIGEELYLAEKTVKNYVSSLLAKLGFERRTQAALYLAQTGQGH
jgi:DNA-binding NarL/FixJ family response regulator